MAANDSEGEGRASTDGGKSGLRRTLEVAGGIVGIAVGITQLLQFCGSPPPPPSTGQQVSPRPTGTSAPVVLERTPAPAEPEQAAPTSAVLTFSQVYADKPFGLSQPDCGVAWIVDFEGLVSTSQDSDQLEREVEAAKSAGRQVPYDMYFDGCSGGVFGSYGSAGLVQVRPESAQECLEVARTGGWAGGFGVKEGAVICTTTDQGLARVVVEEEGLWHLKLSVTLWRRDT